jgi:8-oxo-dGTP diphosphatase
LHPSGILTDEHQARIRLRDGELNEYRFCQADEARRMLRPYVWDRIDSALTAIDTGATLYLHNGQRP